jgi:hypothetical protein
VHRQHAVWFANPLCNSNLIPVKPERSVEPLVTSQKLDNGLASRPRLRAECFQVSTNKRLRPAPAAAKCADKSRNNSLGLRFACENRICQRLVKRGATHDRLRQKAPTSLALRDRFCAVAQRRSPDEFPVIHVAPGYPRRGQHRTEARCAPGLELPAARASYERGRISMLRR